MPNEELPPDDQDAAARQADRETADAERRADRVEANNSRRSDRAEANHARQSDARDPNDQRRADRAEADDARRIDRTAANDARREDRNAANDTRRYDREETASERRVDRLGREAFELAVESATKAATQQVARIHRIRLVTWSASLSFLASAAVFAVIAVVLYGQLNAANVTNTRYNCRVLTRVSQIMGNGAPDLMFQGKQEGFLSSDTLLRTKQNRVNGVSRLKPGPLKTLLTDPQTAHLEKDSLTLQQQITTYWAKTLGVQLGRIAAQNCTALLK
jgi:hypothetical protein